MDVSEGPQCDLAKYLIVWDGQMDNVAIIF